MSAYLPPGYSGVDRPSEVWTLECDNGHLWTSDVHFEFGCASVVQDVCDVCGCDGERSDAEVEWYDRDDWAEMRLDEREAITSI